MKKVVVTNLVSDTDSDYIKLSNLIPIPIPIPKDFQTFNFNSSSNPLKSTNSDFPFSNFDSAVLDEGKEIMNAKDSYDIVHETYSYLHTIQKQNGDKKR